MALLKFTTGGEAMAVDHSSEEIAEGDDTSSREDVSWDQNNQYGETSKMKSRIFGVTETQRN